MIDVPRVATRRSDLGSFLRVRRSALRPLDVGLEDSVRRHVSGLRREEVAALAGISTTWYTWIEQGREINFSPDVLDNIGRALLLTQSEISYLKVLASEEPPLLCALDPQVPDALRKLVELHEAAPAYIATPRLDLLGLESFRLGHLRLQSRRRYAFAQRDVAHVLRCVTPPALRRLGKRRARNRRGIPPYARKLLRRRALRIADRDDDGKARISRGCGTIGKCYRRGRRRL